MKITAFDKVNLKAIRASMDEALESVAKEYGISISLGKITFMRDTFNVKLTALRRYDLSSAFKQYATSYGHKPEDLNREFTVSGKKFTLIGLRPGAYKKPFLVSDEQGKQYVMPEGMVKRGLGIKDEPPEVKKFEPRPHEPELPDPTKDLPKPSGKVVGPASMKDVLGGNAEFRP